MTQKPLISVIIPVYNVEKYISECVDSVINQTYKNLEIILVDDGSTDNCPQICDEYAKKDDRIKVIHIQNSGSSYARNTGLDNATGEYIAFIDSDDWIDNDTIEYLYNDLITNGADIVCCNFYKAYIETNIPMTWYISEPHLLPNIQAAERALTKMELPSTWAKLYKKHIFDTIRYPVGKIFQDVWVIVDVLMAAEKILYDPTPKYYYRQRKSGIIYSTDKIGKIERKVEMFEARYENINNKFPVLAPVNDAHLYKRYIRTINTILSDNSYAVAGEGRILLYTLLDKIKSKSKEFIKNPNISKDEKFILYLISMRLYKLALKSIKIQRKHRNKKKIVDSKPSEVKHGSLFD